MEEENKQLIKEANVNKDKMGGYKKAGRKKETNKEN
jgi:hypothetical protein